MKGPRVLFSRGHTPGLHSPLEKEAPGPSSSQKGSQRWARSCYGHIEMRGYLDRREPTMCQAAQHFQSFNCLSFSFSTWVQTG